MSRKQYNISVEEFRRYLDLYGSNLDRWPEQVRDSAREMTEVSQQFRKMVEAETRFEETLNLREVEAPDNGLENRIIASAKTQGEAGARSSLSGYLGDIFRSFYLPNPAFALALMLVIGILIGYFTSSVNSVNGNDQLITSQLTFYEGEIYEFEN